MVGKASNDIMSNPANFMPPIWAILLFLLCLRHEKYHQSFVGVQLSQMLLLPEF